MSASRNNETDQENEEEPWLNETYGDRAVEFLSTRQMTAGQYRQLLPLVEQYITYDGAERAAWVQKAFQEVWVGDPIDWDVPTSWPTRKENPHFHSLRMAVRNFFKERGRIRDIVVKLPGKGKSSPDWTPLTVCGDVYKSAINALIEDITGLVPGNKDGWISEYPKARAAIYYSLSDDEHDEIEKLCLAWNETGIPVEKKKQQYTRGCKKLLRKVALECLKKYGVYIFFLQVAEPGVDVRTDLIDFSKDLGLGDKGFAKDTKVDNTLKRLQNFVGRNCGVGETTWKGRKERGNVMNSISNYKIRSSEYRNRDGILLRGDDFTPEMKATEAKNALYYFFSYAHANIAPRSPKFLEPAWQAMARGDLVDTKKYFPKDFVFCDPRNMSNGRASQLLQHILDLGELEFHHWKPKNGKVQPPVELEHRYWAKKEVDPNTAAFDAAKRKALAAMPTHFASTRAAPPAALESAEPPAAPSPTSTAPRIRAAPVISPFGSSLRVAFHSHDIWAERGFIMPPDFVLLPDPDDGLPTGADPRRLDAPCSVPTNVEARAQWSISMLERPNFEGTMPKVLFKTCATMLAELPQLRNHFFAAKNFRRQGSVPFLPSIVTWQASTLKRVEVDSGTSDELETFIESAPWCFARGVHRHFSGIEMCWLFLLGVLMYVERLPASETGNADVYNTLSEILKIFRSYLRSSHSEYEYPGHGPSMKYAIASSRQGYLFSVIQNEESLVDLLSVIQRMPDSPHNPPHDLLDGALFPSWQSPRCGLPTPMHASDQTVQYLESWLGDDARFRDAHTGGLIPREAAFDHLLTVVCLYADINSIQNAQWDARGLLKSSCLRGHEDNLAAIIQQWAVQCTEELEESLSGLELQETKGAAEGAEAFAGVAEDAFAGGAVDAFAGSAEDDYAPPSAASGGPASGAVLGGASGSERNPRTNAAQALEPSRYTKAQKGKGVLRPSAGLAAPQQDYLAAARATSRDIGPLKELVAEAYTTPVHTADVRRQLALGVHNREEEEGRRNDLLRKASRRSNMEIYGQPTRPMQPKTARMTTLPSLPPSVERTSDWESDTVATTPAPKHRKKQRAVESQDMANVSPKRAAARTARQTHQPVAKKTIKRKRLSTTSKKPAARKRPVASNAKRAAGHSEPEADSSDSSDAGAVFGGAGPSHARRGAVGDMPELDDEADPDTDPERPEVIVKHSTKRRRGLSHASSTAGVGPLSSPPRSRHAHKRPRVEVYLDAPKSRSHPPVSQVPIAAPKARMVFTAGSRAALAAESRRQKVVTRSAAKDISPTEGQTSPRRSARVLGKPTS